MWTFLFIIYFTDCLLYILQIIICKIYNKQKMIKHIENLSIPDGSLGRYACDTLTYDKIYKSDV